MRQPISPEQLEVLRAYAAGQIGTRRAIDAIGAHDYADLVIALVQSDLDFPKPAATPTHEANLARARAILQPRLRHAD
jgi:hypothetical protein